LQTILLEDEHVALASDGSITMNHPRGYGSNAKVVEQYVVNDSLLSLEEAIYKMTGLPAKILGLKDRGHIAVGKKADLVLFNPLNFKSEATYDNPHVLATGISMLLINGALVIDEGKLINVRKGKVILRAN
jgi:N-acyl-D-amino-acid deacylase